MMGHVLKRAQVAAAIGVQEDEVNRFAVFRAENAQLLLDFLSFGFGMAMATAFIPNLPEGIDPLKIMDPINELIDDAKPLVELPHHLLIVVAREQVHLRHHSRHEPVGKAIWVLEKQTYEAHLHRGTFQVELHFESEGLGYEGLIGKWGVFHRAPMRTARAVVSLARAPK